jgi:SOS response regulatory protein OraA/RecX
MKVTEIVSSTHKAGLYRVSIDNKPVGYVSAEDIFSLALAVGRELSQPEYTRLLEHIRSGAFFYDALHYADRRLRSKKEVVLYLIRKGCEQQAAVQIAAKLEQQGIIDEPKLAEAYIHDSLIGKPMSKRMLEQKLKQKNVSAKIIAAKLDNPKLNDNSSLEALIERKSHLSSYANNKNRLIRYLIAQGFRYEDIVERIGRPEFKKRPPVR